MIPDVESPQYLPPPPGCTEPDRKFGDLPGVTGSPGGGASVAGLSQVSKGAMAKQHQAFMIGDPCLEIQQAQKRGDVLTQEELLFTAKTPSGAQYRWKWLRQDLRCAVGIELLDWPAETIGLDLYWHRATDSGRVPMR